MASVQSRWTELIGASRRHYRKIAEAVGTTAAALIGLWFIGWLTVGDRLLPIRWGAFAAPWLAMIAVASAILLAIGSRPLRSLLAALLGLLILVPILPRLDPLGGPRSAAARDLRAMTFNISMENENDEIVAERIVRDSPDVVFLQQVLDVPALLAAIGRQPNHKDYSAFPQGATADIVTLSRFPIVQTRRIDFGVAIVVKVKDCDVELLNLHAPHGQFDFMAQQTYFAEAARFVAAQSGPMVAGGDLNSNEFNSVQAPLRARLSDAFAEAGHGLGFTFPSAVRRFGTFGRLFRIDHLFHNASFEALYAHVSPDNAGSDHFPVVADFKLTGVCGRPGR